MIYQPRNVTPTKKSVDIRVLNQHLTMEISTNSSVIAYQLFILDWNNNQRYNGSKVNLSTPLYNGDTLYIEIPAPSISYLENGNDYNGMFIYIKKKQTCILQME